MHDHNHCQAQPQECPGRQARAALLAGRRAAAAGCVRRAAPRSGDPAERVSFGTSGHRGRRSSAVSTNGTCSRSPRRSASTAARRASRPALHGHRHPCAVAPALPARWRCWRRTGGNADRRGRRDTRRHRQSRTPSWPTTAAAQRPGRRDRHHAVAQSARQWWLQVQPSERRPGRYRRPPGSRTAPTRCWRAVCEGVQADAFARRCAPRRRMNMISRAYVADLGQVVDFDAIRGAGIRMGVDPLGGAGVHYWSPDRRALPARPHGSQRAGRSDVSLHDTRLGRQDPHGPSSSYAMQRLIGLKNRYDVAFACDTDHDRHGIVTRGRLAAAQSLPVGRDRLPVPHRPQMEAEAAVGKTWSAALIDRVAARLGRRLHEVPVGFKWFVDGLFDGRLGFGGEESAGAAFSAATDGVEHRQGWPRRGAARRPRSRRARA